MSEPITPEGADHQLRDSLEDIFNQASRLPSTIDGDTARARLWLQVGQTLGDLVPEAARYRTAAIRNLRNRMPAQEVADTLAISRARVYAILDDPLVPVPRPPASVRHERSVSSAGRVEINGQHVPVLDETQKVALAAALEAIDRRLNRGVNSSAPRALYSHIMQGKDSAHMYDQMRYRHDAPELTDEEAQRALDAITDAFAAGRQP